MSPLWLIAPSAPSAMTVSKAPLLSLLSKSNSGPAPVPRAPGRLLPRCMAAPGKKKRRRGPIEPVLTDTPIEATEYASVARYCEMTAEDGSRRLARHQSRGERENSQAFSDFFGILPELAADANVRSMEAILASLVEKMDISVAEHAPEVLADAWRKAAGEFLASRAELISIAKRQARIRTAHPAVRYELAQRKNQIIRILNSVLGADTVKTVQIIHG